MPVIFGHELKGKTLWIGGGLIAAAVAVVVFLRARAASAAQAAGASPQPDQGQQSAGGGMSIPAPTSDVANQYQQQLDNSQLEAQAIANKYQTNLVAQQQKQWEFQQKEQAALEPDILAEQRSELQQETHINKDLLKARISCPGGQGVALSPGGPGLPPLGMPYCRQKTSGNWGPLPVGDASRAIEGAASGAAAAAPNIGAQFAKDAYNWATGKFLPPSRTAAPASGNPTARQPAASIPSFTSGINPNPSVGHGYGDA